MIQFLRRIRQSLLKNNKTSTYLKYAVGEIILVVIGILIALQINNWNQQRLQNNTIQQGLSEVKNNLVSDSLQMTDVIKRMEAEMKIQKEIIEVIENGGVLDPSFNENLGKCMALNTIQVTQNGYQTLKRIGLENIKNKELENYLIGYYDILNKDFYSEVEDDNVDLMNVWLPYVRKNFKDFDYRNYAIPKSYEVLSADGEFLIMLKININNREATLKNLLFMQERVRYLIEKIKLDK
ncbi:MAG: hypothetical protein HKN68_06230 [Saprospiraceae bacterium]|nr:hypothetical protein [Saprospiraceae bacterium]